MPIFFLKFVKHVNTFSGLEFELLLDTFKALFIEFYVVTVVWLHKSVNGINT